MEGILGLILYFLGSPGGAFLRCAKEFMMRFLGPCWYSTHFLPDICFDFEVFMVLRQQVPGISPMPSSAGLIFDRRPFLSVSRWPPTVSYQPRTCRWKSNTSMTACRRISLWWLRFWPTSTPAEDVDRFTTGRPKRPACSTEWPRSVNHLKKRNQCSRAPAR